MELRQLRYFVSLAEELHFGRAAAREHIVQSALSQQLQRLERELGVRLMERSTHHVELTKAGGAFLDHARQILADLDRAAEAARRAAGSTPTLRAGIIDASYDSMPQILAQVQARHPELEIHQIETGVPEQFKMLLDGRLDVGFGPAWLSPPGLASELFRLDPVGVVVLPTDPLAELPGVPVAALADIPLIFVDEDRAPAFNRVLLELCRSVRFAPIRHRGRVASIRAAHHLVAQGRCLLCAPSSCASALNGLLWKPLVEPVASYPWSVLWHSANQSRYVRAVVSCARILSRELGWLDESKLAARAPGRTGLASA